MLPRAVDSEGQASATYVTGSKTTMKPIASPIAWSPVDTDVAASQLRCHINSLPTELLVCIFSRFDVVDLVRCVAPVCRLWWNISRDWSARRLFSIDSCRLGGFNVRPIALLGLLSGCPLLTELRLGCYYAVSDPLLEIVSVTCKRLRVLDIAFAVDITEAGIECILSRCSRLSWLNIEGCASVGANALATMACLPMLRHLN
eukprot:Opistho-2@17069